MPKDNPTDGAIGEVLAIPRAFTKGWWKAEGSAISQSSACGPPLSAPRQYLSCASYPWDHSDAHLTQGRWHTNPGSPAALSPQPPCCNQSSCGLLQAQGNLKKSPHDNPEVPVNEQDVLQTALPQSARSFIPTNGYQHQYDIT